VAGRGKGGEEVTEGKKQERRILRHDGGQDFGGGGTEWLSSRIIAHGPLIRWHCKLLATQLVRLASDSAGKSLWNASTVCRIGATHRRLCRAGSIGATHRLTGPVIRWLCKLLAIHLVCRCGMLAKHGFLVADWGQTLNRDGKMVFAGKTLDVGFSGGSAGWSQVGATHPGLRSAVEC
jgi:hypothetical protein